MKILLALVLAFGCSRGEAATLHWSNQADAVSLDPHATNETMSLRFMGNVYDTLVMRDQDYRIVPWLASGWQVMEPTRWRFTLRAGVTFAEGEAFTAADVVFSLRRAAGALAGVNVQMAGIDHVDQVDDHTVDIVTKGPLPTLLTQLCNIFIMNAAWAERHDAAVSFGINQLKAQFTTTHANGTGAYVITERSADSSTVFTRRAGWWGTNPGNITDVVFNPIGNAGTRLAALLSGKVELIQPVPVQDVTRLQSAEGIKVLQTPEIRVMYVGLNVASPTLLDGTPNPLRDVRVREALYRAVDEAGIVRSVMHGFATPTGLFLAQNVIGYDPALDSRLPYDPERARALLREAGYPDGFSLTFDCPNDRYVNDETICRAISAMFARIGVRTAVHSQAKVLYFPWIQTRQVDIYLQGFAPNSFDGYEAFFYTLATRADTNPATRLGAGQGTSNSGHYSNPALDAALLQISQTIDPGARLKLFDQVHAIYRRDIPSLPLHQQANIWAMRSTVAATPTADDSVTFRWITVVEPTGH